MATAANTTDQFIELYETLYRLYTGRTYHVSPSHTARIGELVRILNENNIFAGEYLRFCRRKFGMIECYLPRICSQSVIRMFLRENPDLEADVAMRIDSQIRYLFNCNANGSGDSVYDLLSDEWAGFTPLFRLTLATRFGYTDIVERYRDRAAVEKLQDPRAYLYLLNLLKRMSRRDVADGKPDVSPAVGVSCAGYSGPAQCVANIGRGAVSP